MYRNRRDGPLVALVILALAGLAFLWVPPTLARAARPPASAFVDETAGVAGPAPVEQDDQAQQRRRPTDDSVAKPKVDDARAVPRERPQAVPREQPQAVPREQPKNPSPPPRPRTRPDRTNLPHRYFAVPRAYYFPPIDLRAGFYYHPYFGFYYGPYYGPFYPHPGPFDRHGRYTVSALRIRVRPAEAQVYINGYYAGIADDFDGVFQRLYLPAGEHHLELRLDGYESFGQNVYVALGDTLDIRHQMTRLAPGKTAAPPPRPRSVPEEWTAPNLDGESESLATPFGVLAIRSDPVDAQILIDGEPWVPAKGQRELVIHLTAGWHRVEVRKEAFRTFSTSVEFSEGQTTRLNVTLER